MNRVGWSKPLGFLFLVAMAAAYYAKARGYIGLGRDTIILLFGAAGLTLSAVLARRGESRVPAVLRPVRVSKLVWAGAGLVLISVAWLVGGFALFGSDASLGTLAPFGIMLLSGLTML